MGNNSLYLIYVGALNKMSHNLLIFKIFHGYKIIQYHKLIMIKILMQDSVI